MTESGHLGKKVACPHCGMLFVVAPNTLLGEARGKTGLSLQNVADRVGISIRTLGRLEKGLVTPDLALARKLAALYDTTIDELWPPSAEPVDLVEENAETPEVDD